MSFKQVLNNLLEEKNQPLTGYDYYKSLRKKTPPTGTAFKDRKKYNRKQKHNKQIDLHDSFNKITQSILKESPENEEVSVYSYIANILTTYGAEKEIGPVTQFIQKVVTIAFNKGYKAGTENPFR